MIPYFFFHSFDHKSNPNSFQFDRYSIKGSIILLFANNEHQQNNEHCNGVIMGERNKCEQPVILNMIQYQTFSFSVVVFFFFLWNLVERKKTTEERNKWLLTIEGSKLCTALIVHLMQRFLGPLLTMHFYFGADSHDSIKRSLPFITTRLWESAIVLKLVTLHLFHCWNAFILVCFTLIA